MAAMALRGTWVQTVCIVLTLVTIFMGSFMGCTENGLKKRLAYSSISQISYVLLGVFLMTPVGRGAFAAAVPRPGQDGVSAGSIIFLTAGTETIKDTCRVWATDPVAHQLLRRPGSLLVGIPPPSQLHKWYLERLTYPDCDRTSCSHAGTRWHSFGENIDYAKKGDASLCYVNSKRSGDQITIAESVVKEEKPIEHRD